MRLAEYNAMDGEPEPFNTVRFMVWFPGRVKFIFSVSSMV